jgi:hypothetical protein
MGSYWMRGHGCVLGSSMGKEFCSTPYYGNTMVEYFELHEALSLLPFLNIVSDFISLVVFDASSMHVKASEHHPLGSC